MDLEPLVFEGMEARQATGWGPGQGRSWRRERYFVESSNQGTPACEVEELRCHYQRALEARFPGLPSGYRHVVISIFVVITMIHSMPMRSRTAWPCL